MRRRASRARVCYPLGMTTADNHDLKSPLPHDVLAGGLGRWSLYQTYPTFSWAWLRRRAAVFCPLALLAGSAFGAWHASGMNAWGDWAPLAWRACLALLLMVTLGPLLATIVRHMRWPLAIERTLVVIVILFGLCVAVVATNWAGAYHAHLMSRYRGMSMNVSWLGQAISDFFALSINASTFVLLFSGGGLAVFYYLTERRRIARYAAQRDLSRLRAERDAADLRLAVLQAQVEPHFLFNTLASVRSLIATEPERAAQTVDALADYLRATLPRLRGAGLEDATLGNQVEISARYLDLMNVRMAGRVQVVIDLSDEARETPFPPLILLTLVENAIKHGVEPKPGPVTIAIRARVADDRLEVSVEDDGAGLRPGIVYGGGLSNVRAQLRTRFEDHAALTVEARPEGGTRATIRIPKP
ncbi:MAG: histidine kinase [Pseudomonadota bacterium]